MLALQSLSDEAICPEVAVFLFSRGQRGQLPRGAADEGKENSLTKNILTTIKVSLMKFAE